MSNELVRCEKLRKSFGQIQALDGVDLTLESGKIIGLLGPNGAGKTTLLKVINGLLRPDSGEVTIEGFRPGTETKKRISYLPDRPYFADWMKVFDMLDLFADFYADFDRDKAVEMCRTLHLDGNQKIKTLSKGTLEKLQLILIMSRKAKLYLLDEPIAGVDPAAREFILKTILTNYSETGSVLISTHLILDVEQVLDDAIFMDQGRITLHESVDEIRENRGKSVDVLFRDMFRNNFGGDF